MSTKPPFICHGRQPASADISFSSAAVRMVATAPLPGKGGAGCLRAPIRRIGRHLRPPPTGRTGPPTPVVRAGNGAGQNQRVEALSAGRSARPRRILSPPTRSVREEGARTLARGDGLYTLAAIGPRQAKTAGGTAHGGQSGTIGDKTESVPHHHRLVMWGCKEKKGRRPWSQTGPRSSWHRVTFERRPCCWPCARTSR